MSLQKGKLFRRVQPWTAANNYIDDSRPGARLIPSGIFNWNGSTKEVNTGEHSNLYLFNRATCGFEWSGLFHSNFDAFSFAFAVSPLAGSPDSLHELSLADAFGSTLDAKWRVTPNTFAWSFSGDFYRTVPFSIHLTGLFSQLVTWGWLCVDYNSEP